KAARPRQTQAGTECSADCLKPGGSRPLLAGYFSATPPLQGLCLAPAHESPFSCRLVIVSAEMQEPVDKIKRQFKFRARITLGARSHCRFGAHDDLAADDSSRAAAHGSSPVPGRVPLGPWQRIRPIWRGAAQRFGCCVIVG